MLLRTLAPTMGVSLLLYLLFPCITHARDAKEVIWCCLSAEELAKCEAFSLAATQAQDESDLTFGSSYRHLKCRQYKSMNDCMQLLDNNDADTPNLLTVDAGDVFTGGRYHSLVPIMREVYDQGRNYYHSVAIVKKDTMKHVRSMHDLRGAKACFARVGSLASWTVPIHRLITSKVMPIVDCNNHVKSAIDFFGISCAVNSLQDRFNPLGDNSHHFCELCGSDTPGVQCTNRDPYAKYAGALECLKAKGDVAFLNEKVVYESGENVDNYELLCPQGDVSDVLVRRPLSEGDDCSWGVAPSNALVVSSAMDMSERLNLQIFLQKSAELFGQRQGRNATRGGGEQPDSFEADMADEHFRLFESVPKYGSLRDLLFSDNTRYLEPIEPGEMSYKAFLGKSYGDSANSPMKAIEGVHTCPVGDMKLCVTSEAELAKCVRMRTALNAQLLEPKMGCTRAKSHVECMQQIRQDDANVVVLDAGDVYRAGWQFDLIPIMAEIYNLDTPHYYAVAVAKQRDNSSELIYLKRKNTCHTGVGHAAGWVVPMAWLIANERVRDYGCDSVRAASEYFSKSCVPGAVSPYFRNTYEDNFWEHSHLCDLCHGTAGNYCKRNHMEDYFGHTGAFRCLVEGGGNVAFVKHTTVMENCDGKRKEWWARNQLTSDYELLCRDGTRAPARNYKSCFLGKVKSNAIVTNPRYGRKTIEAYINLFKYAQQYYGQKVPDEFSFSMFYSPPPYADLIFQDATQQLIVLDEVERHYTTYLDKDFLKAYTIVECKSNGHKMDAGRLILLLPLLLISIALFTQ